MDFNAIFFSWICNPKYLSISFFFTKYKFLPKMIYNKSINQLVPSQKKSSTCKDIILLVCFHCAIKKLYNHIYLWFLLFYEFLCNTKLPCSGSTLWYLISRFFWFDPFWRFQISHSLKLVSLVEMLPWKVINISAKGLLTMTENDNNVFRQETMTSDKPDAVKTRWGTIFALV